MYISKHIEATPHGDITIVRIENAAGCWVRLSSLGAAIIGLAVPDRNGFIRNVALSYANPADYMADGPCLGKTPGRYANRIGEGRLEIDGVEYRLPVNNGPNHLHGGPEGFQNKIWNCEIDGERVIFNYLSPDGEMGYPGNLEVRVIYTWSEDNRLSIEFEARTDKKTVVNLTNHTYWNLRGGDFASALDHKLKINASRYLPTDENLTPTGELASVAGTPMDFRTMHRVGDDISNDFPALNFGKGYDACWVIDEADGTTLREAVELCDSESGRTLTVSTDQPGVQIYTGNWLSGSPANPFGRPYEDYEGIAIEAQGFPDAPNHPGFPSQILTPGETYRRHIEYAFGLTPD